MKVGIIQVDGKLPNLALMQICAYHEQLGDQVLWYEGPLFSSTYDKVYASKIFDFSPLPNLPAGAIIGGTGISEDNRLPADIAACNPSWTLYPTYPNHLGFSMKGCRFRCKFCVVPKKEGRPRANATLDQLLSNPIGENRLVLMDNDFFGGPNWHATLESIIDRGLKVCFVQGLNIRILTDEQAELLAACRYYNSSFKKRMLQFAWDRFQDGELIRKGIERCDRYGIRRDHLQFFVLIGYDSSPEQDLARVTMLKDWGCRPFVMAYDRSSAYQRSFQRWVNHVATFKSCSWEDYKYRVTA